MKKIEVTWIETVTQEATAVFEVKDDFIVDEQEILNMDINPEDYYIDEGLYEQISFNDHDDIKYSETIDFMRDSVKIQSVSKG